LLVPPNKLDRQSPRELIAACRGLGKHLQRAASSRDPPSPMTSGVNGAS
jgi:hypothetical protein